ncbi:MAG: PGPGW domain-containing protein [Pseudomonadota bacterium]
MEQLWQWFNEHGLWLGLFSMVTFFASLLLIPILVARIPADYFVDRKRHLSRSKQLRPLLYVIFMVTKNLFGALVFIAGIAMLVLPGQGILTILIGITLMNFPGKFSLERRIVSQTRVYNAINWIRERAGKAPLIHPRFNTEG